MGQRATFLCIVFVGAIGLFRTRRKQRARLGGARNLAMFAFLLLTLAGGALMSCDGGSSTSTATIPTTPGGTSTVTITATGGSQTQTTSLSLTIQ